MMKSSCNTLKPCVREAVIQSVACGAWLPRLAVLSKISSICSQVLLKCRTTWQRKKWFNAETCKFSSTLECLCVHACKATQMREGWDKRVRRKKKGRRDERTMVFKLQINWISVTSLIYHLFIGIHCCNIQQATLAKGQANVGVNCIINCSSCKQSSFFHKGGVGTLSGTLFKSGFLNISSRSPIHSVRHWYLFLKSNHSNG